MARRRRGLRGGPPSPSWVDPEPGLAAVGAELGRLLRRALTRPLLVLGLGLLLALAFGARYARRGPSYATRIVLRVTEGDLDMATSPRPAGRLFSWVQEVAFNSGALWQLAQRHRLFHTDWDQGSTVVVEKLREDIAIEVWRNYFVEARDEGDPVRSARIAVSFFHGDPAVAYAVANDLGKLLVESQQSHRLQIAEQGLAAADHALEMSRDEVARLRSELALARALQRDDPRIGYRLQIERLQRRIDVLQQRLFARVRDRETMALRLELERRQMGLQFHLVDGGRQATRGPPRLLHFLRFTAVGVLIFVPLVILTVGALDRRIYRGEDVRRLGLSLLGEIGDFDGLDRRRLAARRRRAERGVD